MQGQKILYILPREVDNVARYWGLLFQYNRYRPYFAYRGLELRPLSPKDKGSNLCVNINRS